jgi:hypothetical protein
LVACSTFFTQGSIAWIEPQAFFGFWSVSVNLMTCPIDGALSSDAAATNTADVNKVRFFIRFLRLVDLLEPFGPS